MGIEGSGSRRFGSRLPPYDKERASALENLGRELGEIMLLRADFKGYNERVPGETIKILQDRHAPAIVLANHPEIPGAPDAIVLRDLLTPRVWRNAIILVEGDVKERKRALSFFKIFAPHMLSVDDLAGNMGKITKHLLDGKKLIIFPTGGEYGQEFHFKTRFPDFLLVLSKKIEAERKRRASQGKAVPRDIPICSLGISRTGLEAAKGRGGLVPVKGSTSPLADWIKIIDNEPPQGAENYHPSTWNSEKLTRYFVDATGGDRTFTYPTD